LQMRTAKPCARFEVTTQAGGSISHAGSALLGGVADRVAFPSTLDRDSPAGERPPLSWLLAPRPLLAVARAS
jgi:hypothetical protein